jgi:hypothetical protein
MALSKADRKWREERLARQSAFDRSKCSARAVEARTQLAQRLYVACLQGELLTNWTGIALDNLAKECARAALHFSMAEVVIHAHYHDLGKEAKDGEALPE